MATPDPVPESLLSRADEALRRWKARAVGPATGELVYSIPGEVRLIAQGWDRMREQWSAAIAERDATRSGLRELAGWAQRQAEGADTCAEQHDDLAHQLADKVAAIIYRKVADEAHRMAGPDV